MEKWKKYYNTGIFLICFGSIVPLFIIINTILNIPELLVDFVSRALLIGTPLLISGILNVRYALKHKDDPHFVPYGTLYVSKKEIDELIQEGLIKGLGLENEPFKFNIGVEDGISRIFMAKTNFYFYIENLTLTRLTLLRCENILITRNIIKYLLVRSSAHITITDNIFRQYGYDKRCNNIFIENNKTVKKFNL